MIKKGLIEEGITPGGVKKSEEERKQITKIAKTFDNAKQSKHTRK